MFSSSAACIINFLSVTSSCKMLKMMASQLIDRGDSVHDKNKSE